MILKKPYAFLIKNFKKIHLILTAIYIYLAFKTNSILTFYNNFISNKIGKINAINYVSSNYLYAVIISIIINIIILILIIHKKKPKILYIYLILIYIAVASILSISIGGLKTIYVSVLDTQTIRLYRDLLRIIMIVQYITVIITLIRGLGFDIKKFDFVKDLNEMDIEVTDNEEVELTLGNTNNITRKLRRKKRELKYYYIENKSFINISILVIVIILVLSFTINKKVINKVYSEREIFSTSDFNFQVVNTYITNKSSNNTLLTNNDTSYLIVKLGMNPTGKNKTFNEKNLILLIDNDTYKVDNTNAINFIDIGYGFKNQTISSTSYYLFIYKIPNEKIKRKKILKYSSDKEIQLNPINLDEISNIENLKINDTINLESTILSKGNITISSYEINNNYTYEYKYEINGKEFLSNIKISSASNTILKLNLSSSLPNDLTIYDLISKYGKIKYKQNNEEKTSSLLNNRTPGNYKEGLYLEVDKNIENADNLYLELTIRNKKFIYTIK